MGVPLYLGFNPGEQVSTAADGSAIKDTWGVTVGTATTGKTIELAFSDSATTSKQNALDAVTRFMEVIQATGSLYGAG